MFTKGNSGKPKGAKNKTTIAAKEAIARAAEGLGGVKRLMAWVKEDPKNESVFWSQIFTKLVPHEVTGEGGGPIIAAVIDELHP